MTLLTQTGEKNDVSFHDKASSLGALEYANPYRGVLVGHPSEMDYENRFPDHAALIHIMDNGMIDDNTNRIPG